MLLQKTEVFIRYAFAMHKSEDKKIASNDCYFQLNCIILPSQNVSFLNGN